MYIDRYVGGRREGGGYTPFEFISFSDIVLRHEVVQRVEAPVAKCFQIWKDRFNWLQWFDMIEEVGVGGPLAGWREGAQKGLSWGLGVAVV